MPPLYSLLLKQTLRSPLPYLTTSITLALSASLPPLALFPHTPKLLQDLALASLLPQSWVLPLLLARALKHQKAHLLLLSRNTRLLTWLLAQLASIWLATLASSTAVLVTSLLWNPIPSTIHHYPLHSLATLALYTLLASSSALTLVQLLPTAAAFSTTLLLATLGHMKNAFYHLLPIPTPLIPDMTFLSHLLDNPPLPATPPPIPWPYALAFASACVCLLHCFLQANIQRMRNS